MKTFLTLAALMISTAANAWTLPPHQPNGYRDTGCDLAQNVDKGGYLNNPTCPRTTESNRDNVEDEPEEPTND